jgi:hypothetical protein
MMTGRIHALGATRRAEPRGSKVSHRAVVPVWALRIHADDLPAPWVLAATQLRAGSVRNIDLWNRLTHGY